MPEEEEEQEEETGSEHTTQGLRQDTPLASSGHPYYSLQILTNDTSLNVNSEVVLINPQDAIHLRHIKRDNRSPLVGRTFQSSRYISTTWTPGEIVDSGREEEGRGEADSLKVSCDSQ